jgi:hypothetical protein
VRFKFASLEDPLRVSVVERTGEPAPSATVVLRGDSLVHMLGTDLDGQAELEVPAEGTFVLAASKQGRSASVPVTRAKKAVTLTLEPAARIHLRIDNGTGLSRIITSTEHQEVMDELRATGSEAWLEEVVAGVITVTVTSADGTRVGRAQVTTTAGQVSEARVDLSPGARVKGKVTLPSPTLAFVVLESASGTEGAPVEADGSYEVPSLVPGAWSARVNCRGCSFPTKSVTLAAGATVELNFP